jgi:Fic family protein
VPSEARASAWPALTYESLPWQPAEPAYGWRTARRRHRGPYEAAIAPEIAEAIVSLPSDVAAIAEEAAAEIARFDAELGREIAPFAAVLLCSESAASSKIERLTASSRAIAEAELHGHAGRNASLIVANQRAMTAAIALAERIDADAILAMHAALLDRSDPDRAGQWRDQPVWIGGGALGPHGAAFVPPHHSRVQANVDDLVRFIARDDVPILAHAAIAHAQFETIHPFPDGNGRTGRALVHAHLRAKGLIRNVTVPVSAGLLTDVGGYFTALTRYRDGEPTPIVESFASAALQAVANGRRLVEDLHAILQDCHDRVRARRDAATWRVADLLLRHPVVNAALVAAEVGIAPQNIYRSVRPLVDAGVLVEVTDRKRNQLWRAPEVLDALDRFAARAGRRTRASG